MIKLSQTVLALSVLTLTACGSPDPEDYGGGAKGEAIAKCISRTERADSSITREQAGEMCTCLTDKMVGAIGGRGMSREVMTRCATRAGITLT